MNRNFEEAVKKLLAMEGEYVNDPNDAGGETKYGISKRSYPHLNIKEVTEEQAKRIYYTDFWLKNKCENIATCFIDDRICEVIAQKLFNFSVNMGNAQAAKLFQRAINDCARVCGYHRHNFIKEDGVIGTFTLASASELFKEEQARRILFLPIFKLEAANFYRKLAETRRRGQEKFLAGWLNRAFA